MYASKSEYGKAGYNYDLKTYCRRCHEKSPSCCQIRKTKLSVVFVVYITVIFDYWGYYNQGSLFISYSVVGLIIKSTSHTGQPYCIPKRRSRRLAARVYTNSIKSVNCGIHISYCNNKITNQYLLRWKLRKLLHLIVMLRCCEVVVVLHWLQLLHQIYSCLLEYL